MAFRFPEPTLAWIQDSPLGNIYVESTALGVSRLEFGIPNDALRIGTDMYAANALESYFAKPFSGFDQLNLDLTTLTDFRREVVETLRLIPAGETLTYKELAAKLGKPQAARAIGQAVGANPVPIIAPCHRVLAAQAKLGGYSGGLDNKRWLLAHEGISYNE